MFVIHDELEQAAVPLMALWGISRELDEIRCGKFCFRGLSVIAK